MERSELISWIRIHVNAEDWKDYGYVYNDMTKEYESALFDLPPGFFWDYLSAQKELNYEDSGWVIKKVGNDMSTDESFLPIKRFEVFI